LFASIPQDLRPSRRPNPYRGQRDEKSAPILAFPANRARSPQGRPQSPAARKPQEIHPGESWSNESGPAPSSSSTPPPGPFLSHPVRGTKHNMLDTNPALPQSESAEASFVQTSVMKSESLPISESMTNSWFVV
jgi:hypothetical protein